jgi:hypothetical protein
VGTPLVAATMHNRLHFAQTLFNTTELSEVEIDAAATCITWTGSTDMIDLFISHGYDINNDTDFLRQAIEMGQDVLVMHIIKRHNAVLKPCTPDVVVTITEEDIEQRPLINILHAIILNPVIPTQCIREAHLPYVSDRVHALLRIYHTINRCVCMSTRFRANPVFTAVYYKFPIVALVLILRGFPYQSCAYFKQIRYAFIPWRRSTHIAYSIHYRANINTIFLVAAVLGVLPIELWHLICSFFQRTDFPIDDSYYPYSYIQAIHAALHIELNDEI